MSKSRGAPPNASSHCQHQDQPGKNWNLNWNVALETGAGWSAMRSKIDLDWKINPAGRNGASDNSR